MRHGTCVWAADLACGRFLTEWLAAGFYLSSAEEHKAAEAKMKKKAAPTVAATPGASSSSSGIAR